MYATPTTAGGIGGVLLINILTDIIWYSIAGASLIIIFMSIYSFVKLKTRET